MSLKSLRSEGESSILSKKETGCRYFGFQNPVLTGIIVDRSDLRRLLEKKSFNPLLAASASLLLFGLTHSGRTKISQNLYIKPVNNCTVPYLTSLSSSSFSGRSRMTSRRRTRLSTDPSVTYCASEIHSGVAIVLNGMFLSAASHQVAHLHHGGCLLLGQQPAGHVLHHAEHLGIGRRDRLPL